MSSSVNDFLIPMLHFFVSAAALTAFWLATAAGLAQLVRLSSPSARVFVFTVPLLAAFGARIRLFPDIALEIVGTTLAIALLLLAADVRHYRRFTASLAPELRLSGVLQKIVNELSPSFGIRTPPRAYESAAVGTGPCVIGLSGSILIVPRPVMAQMDAEELRALVAHELAHVGRRDGIWKWLLLFLRRLAFLNPVAFWTHRHISLEIERACDRRAVQVTARPGVFARTLVKVDEIMAHMPQPASSYGMVNVPRADTQLARRIGSIAAYCGDTDRARLPNLLKTLFIFGIFSALCLEPGEVILALTR